MAEHDDREEASRRYRELPREEPPAALDSAIRAHAQRALEEMHPAPLVPPTGRRQWYFPLAAAAILVLAVSVTWHVEREQPDMVAVGPAPSAPERTARQEAVPETKEEPPAQASTRDSALQRKSQAAPKPAREAEVRERQRETAELAKRQAPASAPAPAANEPAPVARADEAQPRLGASARSEVMSQRAFAETPEQWLERIAKLRAEGKHDEADKALAEFRKRHPDFRIAPEMLEKVEKR